MCAKALFRKNKVSLSDADVFVVTRPILRINNELFVEE